MELASALILFFIVLLILVYILRICFHVRVFSSIALAVIISLILLDFIFPLSSLTSAPSDWVTAVYVIIHIIVALLLLFYVISKAICDREDIVPKASCETV